MCRISFDWSNLITGNEPWEKTQKLVVQMQPGLWCEYTYILFSKMKIYCSFLALVIISYLKISIGWSTANQSHAPHNADDTKLFCKHNFVHNKSRYLPFGWAKLNNFKIVKLVKIKLGWAHASCASIRARVVRAGVRKLQSFPNLGWGRGWHVHSLVELHSTKNINTFW
jgi:hypothetical protein